MPTDGAYQLAKLESAIYNIIGNQDINGVGTPIFVAWKLTAIKNSIPAVTRPSTTEFLLPPGEYSVTVTINWNHPGGAVNYGMQYRPRLDGIDDNTMNSYSTGSFSVGGVKGDSWTFPVIVPGGPGIVLSIGSRNQYTGNPVNAITGRIAILKVA